MSSATGGSCVNVLCAAVGVRSVVPATQDEKMDNILRIPSLRGGGTAILTSECTWRGLWWVIRLRAFPMLLFPTAASFCDCRKEVVFRKVGRLSR
jgi:hypothetical protein